MAHVTTKYRGHHLHPPDMDASTAPLIKHHAYHVTSFWMEATLLLLRGSTLANSLRGHNRNVTMLGMLPQRPSIRRRLETPLLH